MSTAGMLNLHTVQSIIRQSVQKNSLKHITGVLCYGNGYFFQYVEGSERALTDLKNRLLNDTRHHNLKILDFSMIPCRCFSDWPMHEWNIDGSLTVNFGTAVDRLLPFNPFEWDSKDLNYFIVLLKARYTESNDEPNEPLNTTTPIYRTLGIAVNNVIGKHQAFFVVQAIMGIIIALAIIMMFFASHIS